MGTTKTLLIPDYQVDTLYSGEVLNNEISEVIDNTVFGKGLTLKQNVKESIFRRTAGWGLELTSGWRLLLDRELTRNVNDGFEEIPDDLSVEIPLTDYLENIYADYVNIVSETIISWRDMVIEENKEKKDTVVDRILTNGNLFGAQLNSEYRGIIGKYSGFTEVNELSISDTECKERLFNTLFISLNKRKHKLEIDADTISDYLSSYNKEEPRRIKIYYTSNTLSKGRKNEGILSILRKKIAKINPALNLTDGQLVYIILLQELDTLVFELGKMKRNAIKKVNEDYKRNCQAIPEEPKNDKVFSYGTKFKKYNEYKNEIVATTYNGFMKLLSERFGKEFSFYQYYADIYMAIPEELYDRIISGTEKYNSHNQTELTSRQYIQLLFKDAIAKQDGLKIARNKKIIIDPQKAKKIKYPFSDPETGTKILFELPVNELVYSEIEKIAKLYEKNEPEMIDYVLNDYYNFLSGYKFSSKGGLNPILENLEVTNATEHMKLTARTLLLTYLYSRLKTCFPYNYKTEEYYRDIIVSAFWYFSQKLENM